MPTTRSGRWLAAAMAVIESDDVLVAKTTSGRQTGSNRAKRSRLTSISSKTASMTKSTSANVAASVE